MFIEILQLELGLLNSKSLILGTYERLLLKMKQLMSLKFKNDLHIIALHMITFYYWEIFISHFLIKT